MKNVLIIGVARAGKTTLGNMIKDEFNQYNIIHADSIIWWIIRGTGREEYYTQNVKARKELVHSDKFQRIILEIYKSSIHQDTKNYGTILESGQLEPKYARELLDMGNLICVCLGHGDLDKQGIMKLCREHDTEKDWTYRISEENLSANADKWDEKNRMLKVECPRYGIEYIDTSKDREKTLQKILSRIGEKVEIREEDENER